MRAVHETTGARTAATPAPVRPGRTDSALAWALRAVRRELLGFRFDYPVEAVPEALRPGALHYYIRSDRLFLDDLVFDSEGVPMKQYRTVGRQYNPLFIAWWGLVNLDRHLRDGDGPSLERFFTQVWWLKEQAVEREDGAVIWPCRFDWQEGWCRLTAPWFSAMYQGVVISALVRAYRLNGDAALLTLCEKGTRVFELAVGEGGVRTLQDGRVLYEEYPGYPLARVLDGFLFSLLGLYDLLAETSALRVFRLFSEGLAGLIATIGYWNYRDKWSWYGARAYLCPPQYQQLNSVLLSVLGEVTGEKILHHYARVWDMRSRSALDKLEIFLAFTLTKNWARLRLPRG